MEDRERNQADRIAAALAIAQGVEAEPPCRQRLSRPLLLGPLQLLDVVITTESLPAEGVRAGQTGTVMAELAADAVLVDFAEHVGVKHAVVPVPINRLRLVQHSGAAADHLD